MNRSTSTATGADVLSAAESSASHETDERCEKENNFLFHRIAQELSMLRQTRVNGHQHVKSKKKWQQSNEEEKENEKGDEDWKKAMALFQDLPCNVEAREAPSGIAATYGRYQTAQVTVLLEHLLFTLFRVQAPPTICHSVYLMCRSLKMPTTPSHFFHDKDLPTRSLRSPFHPKGLYFHYASYLYQLSARSASTGNISQAVFYVSRCLVVLVVHAPLDHSPRSLKPSAMILGLQALGDWEHYKWNLEGVLPTFGSTTLSTASSPAFRSRVESEPPSRETAVDGEREGEEALFNQWLLEKVSTDPQHREGRLEKRSDALVSSSHASSFDTETPSLRDDASFPFLFSSDAPTNAAVLRWSMLYHVCAVPSVSASSVLQAIRLFLSLPLCFSQHLKRMQSVCDDNGYFPLPPLASHSSASFPSNDQEEVYTSRADDHTFQRSHGDAKKRSSTPTLHRSRSCTPLWCATDPSISPHVLHQRASSWREALWGRDVSLAISFSSRVITFLRFLNDEWATTDLIPEIFSLSTSDDALQRRNASAPVCSALRFHLQRAMFLVLEVPSSPDDMWRAYRATSAPVSASDAAPLKKVPNASGIASPNENFPLSHALKEKEEHTFCSLLGWFAHLLLESLACLQEVEGTQSARWRAHSQLVSTTLQDMFFFVKKMNKTPRDSSCVRSSPREVEQELWSLVFDGVRRGVFCVDHGGEEKQGAHIEKEEAQKSSAHATKYSTDTTCLFPLALSSPFSSLTESIPMLLSWIIPLYDSSQWRFPTVNVYITLLDEWKQSKLMSEVFRAIQRREWNALKAAQQVFTQSDILSVETSSESGASREHPIPRQGDEKWGESDVVEDDFLAEIKTERTSSLDRKEKILLADLQRYVPSLSLSSCALIIEHCCNPACGSKGREMSEHFYQNPSLAEDVVKYMLIELLLQQNQKKIFSSFPNARLENAKVVTKNGMLSTIDACQGHSCSRHQKIYDERDCLRWRSWIERAALPMISQCGKGF